MDVTVDDAQDFARDHPYVAVGLLLIPATWGVTGDALTSLFVGGAVAVGPALADGFDDEASPDPNMEENDE